MQIAWANVTSSVTVKSVPAAVQSGTSDSNQAARLQLIKELVNLPYTYSVLDPKYIKLLDSRDIAAALIERQRRFTKRWERTKATSAAASSFPRTADTEVISVLPASTAPQLIHKGQLNLHQVVRGHLEDVPIGKTVIASSRVLRAQVEDLIINIRLEPSYSSAHDAPVHYIRPKYGCVHFLKPCGLLVNPNRWLLYGELIIVYRDTIKQRTTYTYGDSHCRIAMETATIKHPSEPAALVDLAPPDEKHRSVPYVEAQVWGAIDMADVAEFRIPDGRPEIVEALKPAGLPIYTYDRDSMESIDCPIEESTLPIARVRCLYAGDPQRMREYDRIAAQRYVSGLQRM